VQLRKPSIASVAPCRLFLSVVSISLSLRDLSSELISYPGGFFDVSVMRVGVESFKSRVITL